MPSERYVAALREAVDRRELGAIDPEVAAWALMSVGETIGLRWILWGDGEVPEHVIAELGRTDPSTDPFAAKAKVLKDLIEHHAEEEEEEMFPRARKLLPKEELAELGVRLKARKRELLASGGESAAGKVSAA